MKAQTSPPPASDSPPSDSQNPPRSRNARAQARHRAKRKAYIEQLEETVTKLQAALALTPEQTAALGTSQNRIRELEDENARLRRELEGMRAQQLYGASSIRRRSPPSVNGASEDALLGDRDSKRRRMSDDGLYLGPTTAPANGTVSAGLASRALPLPIPDSHAALRHLANSHSLSNSNQLYPLTGLFPLTSAPSAASSLLSTHQAPASSLFPHASQYASLPKQEPDTFVSSQTNGSAHSTPFPLPNFSTLPPDLSSWQLSGYATSQRHQQQHPASLH